MFFNPFADSNCPLQVSKGASQSKLCDTAGLYLYSLQAFPCVNGNTNTSTFKGHRNTAKISKILLQVIQCAFDIAKATKQLVALFQVLHFFYLLHFCLMFNILHQTPSPLAMPKALMFFRIFARKTNLQPFPFQ